jgi:hypothetical protein
MFFGRFVFGLGLEPVNSVKNIMIAQWFIGKELSFASNLNLAVCRMFVFLNGYSTPLIAEDENYTDAFLLGLCFALISLLSTVPITILQRKLNNEKLAGG